MAHPPSLRNREKGARTCRCRKMVQRTDPRAVADGRKQEGFILLLGKLPRIDLFDTSVSRNAMTEWRRTP